MYRCVVTRVVVQLTSIHVDLDREVSESHALLLVPLLLALVVLQYVRDEVVIRLGRSLQVEVITCRGQYI